MTVIGGDDNEDVDAVALRFLLIVATLMAETWFDGKSCMLVFGDEDEDAVDERVFMATSMALTLRRLRQIGVLAHNYESATFYSPFYLLHATHF